MALCWERLFASAKQEPGKGGCLSRVQSAGLVRRGWLRFGFWLSGPCWVDALGADPDPWCHSSMFRLFSRPNHFRSSELRPAVVTIIRSDFPERTAVTLTSRPKPPSSGTRTGNQHERRWHSVTSIKLCVLPLSQRRLTDASRKLCEPVAHSASALPHCSRSSHLPPSFAACCHAASSRRKCCVRAASTAARDYPVETFS
jgi:hypothetical protein